MFAEQDEIHDGWMSFTDLMSGFLVVFILVSVIALNQVPELMDDIQQQSMQQVVAQVKTTGVVSIEASEDHAIRFLTPRLATDGLFAEGSDRLTPDFRASLDDFLPAYLDELGRIYAQAPERKIDVRELRIEGHASAKGSYLYNLDLSSRRAQAVLQHILNHPDFAAREPAFRDRFKQQAISVGYSFSKPLDRLGRPVAVTGREADEQKSRRVEFRIVLEERE